MKNPALFTAICKNELTDELLTKYKHTLEEKEAVELSRLRASKKSDDYNALMVACSEQQSAVIPLCKLIATLPPTEQKKILIQTDSHYPSTGDSLRILTRSFSMRRDRVNFEELNNLKYLLQLLVSHLQDKQLDECDQEVVQSLRSTFSYACLRADSFFPNRGDAPLIDNILNIFCKSIGGLNKDLQQKIITRKKLHAPNHLMEVTERTGAAKSFCKYLETFPKEEITKWVTHAALDGRTALNGAIFRLNSEMAIVPICNLIKKIDLKDQIKIFTQRYKSLEMSPFMYALTKIEAQKSHPNYEHTRQEKRDFWDEVIDPLLEVMEKFPIEVKEQLFNEIPNTFWWYNLYYEERAKIRNAIGVTYPLTTTQSVFFNLSAGTALTSGALWVLMAAGTIGNPQLWPVLLTGVVIGLGAMLAIKIYARCSNSPQLYRPVTHGEEKSLLPGDNHLDSYSSDSGVRI